MQRILRRRHALVAILAPALTLALVWNVRADEAKSPSKPAEQGNRSPRAMVRPIPDVVMKPSPTTPASRKLIQAYYDSLRDWATVVIPRVRPVPDRPGQCYLGLPRHVEDDVRPTCYAAMVLGFLAEYSPPSASIDEGDRQRYREAAKSLLRYLTASHVTGGQSCVNGKPWGNQWQSAMWARAAGMGGWFLWNDLDEDLQAAVARLVEYEADRFIDKSPKSRLLNDTGAEENAWNALVTSLACNMMPGHPRAKAWEEASMRYMYNTFSVKADHRDETPGDLGRPIKDWVTTVNAHDDYTVENHRLVHMGYLKTSASELQECILPWLITGRKIPSACMHHVPEVFEVLIDCMPWDAGPVYFAGTDWKAYHEQSCEVTLYTMLSLLRDDRRAAFLEDVAVEWIARQQKAEGGFYNVRRDLEYGGLCATRLIGCCLAHGIVDSRPEPITAEGFDRLASGTRHLVAGKAVVHRTPSKFASFAWARKRMALSIPREGTWTVWPHFASYLGVVDGKDSSNRHARLVDLDVDVRADGFRVSGRLLRCKKEGKFGLVQDFLFASPPGDYTVYIERVQAAKGFVPSSLETGVIGLEYPVDSNHRTLYGEWGALKTTGYGGSAKVHELAGAWLNIDNQVGYVVLRSDDAKNVIRYHDESRGNGRVPKLQEWISLIGQSELTTADAPTWACLVTFVNQTAKETASWANRVRFDVEGTVATCRIGDEKIDVDFADNGAPASGSGNRE